MKLTACSAQLLLDADRENAVDHRNPSLYDIAETRHRERMEDMPTTREIVHATLGMMSASCPVQAMLRTATVLGMRAGWYARGVAEERGRLEELLEAEIARIPASPLRAPLRLVGAPQRPAGPRPENVADDGALGG